MANIPFVNLLPHLLDPLTAAVIERGSRGPDDIYLPFLERKDISIVEIIPPDHPSDNPYYGGYFTRLGFPVTIVTHDDSFLRKMTPFNLFNLTITPTFSSHADIVIYHHPYDWSSDYYRRIGSPIVFCPFRDLPGYRITPLPPGWMRLDHLTISHPGRDDLSYPVSSQPWDPAPPAHRSSLREKILSGGSPALLNQWFAYHRVFPHRRFLDLAKLLDLTPYPGFHPGSNSLLPIATGYQLVVSLNNYALPSGGQLRYVTPHHENIEGRILRGELDSQFRLRTMTAITSGNAPYDNGKVKGLQDARIVSPHQIIAVSRNEYEDGNSSLVLLTIGPEGVTRQSLPRYRRSNEKNWLPLWKEDRLIFIYDFAPFTLITVEPEITVVKSSSFSRPWRGSASPLPYHFRDHSGYLTLVHMAYDERSEYRRYYHLWVFFTDDTIFYSEPWKFSSEGVEFCLTMVRRDDHLVVGYSVRDCYSYLTMVSLSAIDDSLQYHDSLLP